VRLLAGVVLSLGLMIGSPRCVGADLWGGSLGVTSDYIVRGISRSNAQAALQFDLHYLNDSGFVAGVFASKTRIDPDQSSDAEFSGFAGFAWMKAGSDWHGKILASHYAYPWNRAGSAYDYDELAVDLTYQEWLGVNLVYSPNAPRYIFRRGLIGVTSESAEVNLQRPVLGRLSAAAGIGYSHFDGPYAGGFGYWSVGAAYTIASVSLVVSYVDTTAEAKALLVFVPKIATICVDPGTYGKWFDIEEERLPDDDRTGQNFGQRARQRPACRRRRRKSSGAGRAVLELSPASSAILVAVHAAL
jgi:uncharacterized protein (TIGR02001 family)